MGVAEIAPSTAENAPNYFPTGYTVTPLILTFLTVLGVMGDEKPLGGRKHPKPLY